MLQHNNEPVNKDDNKKQSMKNQPMKRSSVYGRIVDKNSIKCMSWPVI